MGNSIEYKDFSVDLARHAGKIMLENFKLGMERKIKSDNTFLTETDEKINQLVIDAVKREFPDHGIIAEEGNLHDSEEFVWVCDPIDGTIDFSHGIPTFSFSLALVKKGEPILGIIYDPVLDRMFYAAKGEGAFLNDEKISVTKDKSLSHSLVGIINWKTAELNLVGLRDALREHGFFFYESISIAYISALMAAGELGAVVYPGSKPWDVAAAKVIIEEAGGKTSDLFGNKQDYNTGVKGFVGSSGLIHDELLAKVREAIGGKNT